LPVEPFEPLPLNSIGKFIQLHRIPRKAIVVVIPIENLTKMPVEFPKCQQFPQLIIQSDQRPSVSLPDRFPTQPYAASAATGHVMRKTKKVKRA
jgi:hypothetical protein